jgi:hypothetical protein
MEKSLEAMTRWLRNSGLKVQEAKSEVCLFYKKELTPIKVTVCNTKDKLIQKCFGLYKLHKH